MVAVISAIVAVIQSVVQAVVMSVVSTTLSTATQTLVVKLITYAVIAVVLGAIVQVIGKLLGLEKITTKIAKILYMVAIVIVAIAAIIAKSILLALLFLGSALVFLFLVDTLFGTKTASTFSSAVTEVADIIADTIGKVIDVATGIIGAVGKKLLDNPLFRGLLIAAVIYGGYKLLSNNKGESYDSEEQRRDVGRGSPVELTGSGGPRERLATDPGA